MTKLQAINEVLQAIDLPPIAAVPSSASDTTSIGRRAEDVLDQATRSVLYKGFPCNTAFSVAKTLDASGEVDLSAANPAVLKVRGVAPGKFKNSLSLRGGKLYSSELGSTDLGDQNDLVYIDVIELLDFADTSPDVQELIVTEARRKFQQQHQNSQLTDQQLAEERAMREIAVDRLQTEAEAWNTRPIIPQAGNEGPRR